MELASPPVVPGSRQKRPLDRGGKSAPDRPVVDRRIAATDVVPDQSASLGGRADRRGGQPVGNVQEQRANNRCDQSEQCQPI
jgi:hypothetical protein